MRRGVGIVSYSSDGGNLPAGDYTVVGVVTSTNIIIIGQLYLVVVEVVIGGVLVDTMKSKGGGLSYSSTCWPRLAPSGLGTTDGYGHGFTEVLALVYSKRAAGTGNFFTCSRIVGVIRVIVDGRVIEVLFLEDWIRGYALVKHPLEHLGLCVSLYGAEDVPAGQLSSRVEQMAVELPSHQIPMLSSQGMVILGNNNVVLGIIVTEL